MKCRVPFVTLSPAERELLSAFVDVSTNERIATHCAVDRKVLVRARAGQQIQPATAGRIRATLADYGTRISKLTSNAAAPGVAQMGGLGMGGVQS